MLKYILFLFVAVFPYVGASQYENILNHYQPLGSYKDNEIEIVIEDSKRNEIEKKQQIRLIKKGFSLEQAKHFSKTGVVAEDQYWLWVRDAVLFPTGTSGTYDRLILKGAENFIPGSAILAITDDKKIAVIMCFRHATRSWEIEIPRGSRNRKETTEQTATRELQEETGIIVKDIHFLGNVTPDSGLLSSIVPVFLAKIDHQNLCNTEDTEAIDKVIYVEKEKLFAAMEKGYLEVGDKKIPIRDSFLAFALLQAHLKNLL